MAEETFLQLHDGPVRPLTLESSNIDLFGPIDSLNWLSGTESQTSGSRKRLGNVRALTTSRKTATNEREVAASSSESANEDHEIKD